LDWFRVGKVDILVATNLGARGLDIDCVERVINYDAPDNFTDYIHRIGRTGRAGKTGIATTFLSKGDEKIYPELKRFLTENGQAIPPQIMAVKLQGEKETFM
jgi:ATP-dependent RNA helicase DDX23/PRP28